MSNPEYDIFVNRKIYPDAAEIFATSLQSIENIKNQCLFVIDTNALLLPYTITKESINEIKRVYQILVDDKRLFIPGQVAREFAKNRPEKIKELFQKIIRKRDNMRQFSSGKYELLKDISEYKEILDLEKKIDELMQDYSKKIGIVGDHIKEWEWNDPVSKAYSDLFAAEAIFDPIYNEQEIQEKLKFRYVHKIPPGYKDGGKPDDGIGDLLIWQTILDLAKKEKKDVIFITGEEKADWYYKSEGQILYPRYELITEFARESDKHSFHIMKLSELLKLLKADNTAISEISKEEQQVGKIFSMGIALESKEPSKDVVKGAVMLWLIQNVGLKNFMVDENEISDFVSQYENEWIGIEILYYRVPTLMLEEMQNRLNRVSEVQPRYKKLMFFLIFPDRDTMFRDSRAKDVQKIPALINRKGIEYEMIVGYLDDDNKIDLQERVWITN